MAVCLTNMNDELVKALKDFDSVMDDMVDESDIDDEQYNQIQKFKNLPRYEQELFYLWTKTGSGRTVAKLYGCSKSFMYYKIQEIKNKLK